MVEELAHRAAIAIDNARLYQQAEQANRAKSDFLANMSHEIRTPMTAVLGYADILAARIKDPVCSEKISIIKRNGQFLLEIINDILDLSKIEAGRIEAEPERFEVAELVADVLSLMQLRASEKGLQLLLEYKTDVPEYVVSDPIRLRQILVNLIGNAIKFTETGTVTLGVQFDADRRQLLFDVVDTGIGISPELQEVLFRAVQSGRHVEDAQVRRHGPGADDQPATGRNARRDDRRRERAGPRQHVYRFRRRWQGPCRTRAASCRRRRNLPSDEAETAKARLPRCWSSTTAKTSVCWPGTSSRGRGTGA